jgi:hypothetical protein
LLFFGLKDFTKRSLTSSVIGIGHRIPVVSLRATNTFVICFVHEAAERRKATAQQQFQVAELASGQVPGRKVPGLRFELGCSLLAYL